MEVQKILTFGQQGPTKTVLILFVDLIRSENVIKYDKWMSVLSVLV